MPAQLARELAAGDADPGRRPMCRCWPEPPNDEAAVDAQRVEVLGVDRGSNQVLSTPKWPAPEHGGDAGP